ncbi:fused MFS/spermidine synthase [Neolewinella lacunae]|uniref:Fused MFS/spermidine synthase n=1 Tax=Neolewinella lacunae TaxID=1517758 RepID=A0A923PL72_9BACT|nr:fused MFS/spermidine synthase [Neolewinella lacunae]MBC6996090.1 fused MFS/spermidine synthase [Neolewinella lacunae]MDN3633943.1 fused MFS/spermidine synthase [Neolewinella lacunae]
MLETTASDYNAFLQVSLVHGRLQLVAEEAIYSFGDYYLNFRKVFEVFDFGQLPERASVLVLGLGLGSIPELLALRHGLAYAYVAVEIDPVIIELAAEYSLPALDVPLEIHHADAYAFLQLDDRRYDLICVDVFQDATVPEHLGGTDFLDLLKESLAPGGAIIYNRLADTLLHKRQARAYFEDVFGPAFPKSALFDSGGNFMLVNEARFVEAAAGAG